MEIINAEAREPQPPPSRWKCRRFDRSSRSRRWKGRRPPVSLARVVSVFGSQARFMRPVISFTVSSSASCTSLKVSRSRRISTPSSLDTVFTDHNGNTITFGDLFTGERPVLLQLGYFRVLGPASVLNEMTDTIRDIEWTTGKELTSSRSASIRDETQEPRRRSAPPTCSCTTGERAGPVGTSSPDPLKAPRRSPIRSGSSIDSSLMVNTLMPRVSS